MLKFMLISFLLSLSIQNSYSQNEDSFQNKRFTPFIGYELGEAVFNKFQSISGEIGIKFKNNHMVRLTHMNVSLTEEHLSSNFAGAVEGNNVEGTFFGFEGFYDFPLFLNGLYISPSCGYYRNEYSHTVLDQNFENKSPTVGVSVSYKETNIFGIKGLYYMFSFPMRTPINPIKETTLGDTIISNNTFDNNIWLFIGYEF